MQNTKIVTLIIFLISHLTLNLYADDIPDMGEGGEESEESSQAITIDREQDLSLGSFSLSQPSAVIIDQQGNLSAESGSIYLSNGQPPEAARYIISAEMGTNVFIQIENVNLYFTDSGSSLNFYPLISSAETHCLEDITGIEGEVGGICNVVGSPPEEMGNVEIRVYGSTDILDPMINYGQIEGTMLVNVSYENDESSMVTDEF